MPRRLLKRLFGGKTSVEFLNVGPHDEGGDAGDQRSPRAQIRGRSSDYYADIAPEQQSDDESISYSTQPLSSPTISSSPEPTDHDGQASPVFGQASRMRRGRSFSTDTRRAHFDPEADASCRSSDDPRRAHFDPEADTSRMDDVASSPSSQPESQESCQATVGSSTGHLSNVGRTSRSSSGSSGKLSTGARRKNSILDCRMQHLRNLRLELASIRDVSLEQTRRQIFMGKIQDLMNSSLKMRWSAFRRCCRMLASKDLITTPLANTTCSGVIVLNAIFIGLEMELNDDTGFKVEWFLLESGFLAFFIVELGLRFRASSCRASMKDPWIIVDMTMILPGVLDTWVLQFFYASTQSMPRLTVLRLVRLARVARVLRVIRLIRYFHELILLARGILGAVQALSWALVLVFIILYMSAIMTTSWLNYMSKIDADILKTTAGIRLKEWFGSIGASLLTLFQLMTLEGWPEILRTSMRITPQVWLFFVPFILITNVSLLNAITAVVVENVFSIAQNEAADESKRAEKQRLNALKKLKQLFLSIDLDHNATLDLEEFRKAMKDPRLEKILHELGIATYEADELFECLDLDGNQELSVAEFVDGCLRAVGPAQSKHLLQVQYDLIRTFKSLRHQSRDLVSSVRIVLKQVARVHGLSGPERKTGQTKDTRAIKGKETDDNQDVETKASDGTKRTEDDESRSPAATKPLPTLLKDSGGNGAEAQHKFLKDSSLLKLEAVRAPLSRAPSPRRTKNAGGSTAAKYSSSQSSTDVPMTRKAASSSSASSSSKLLERHAPAVIDRRDWKPIGGLLDSTTQDQQAISQILQTLLDEMRDVHGHVSEVSAFSQLACPSDVADNKVNARISKGWSKAKSSIF